MGAMQLLTQPSRGACGSSQTAGEAPGDYNVPEHGWVWQARHGQFWWDIQASPTIECQFASGVELAKYQFDWGPEWPPSRYEIRFLDMKQTNVSSGNVRPVRRVWVDGRPELPAVE